jgi:hypothetical protein
VYCAVTEITSRLHFVAQGISRILSSLRTAINIGDRTPLEDRSIVHGGIHRRPGAIG